MLAVATYFKRTAPAVQRCQNQQKRRSYGRRYNVYLLEVIKEGITWTVEKRYSDFHFFEKQLERNMYLRRADARLRLRRGRGRGAAAGCDVDILLRQIVSGNRSATETEFREDSPPRRRDAVRKEKERRIRRGEAYVPSASALADGTGAGTGASAGSDDDSGGNAPFLSANSRRRASIRARSSLFSSLTATNCRNKNARSSSCVSNCRFNRPFSSPSRRFARSSWSARAFSASACAVTETSRCASRCAPDV